MYKNKTKNRARWPLPRRRNWPAESCQLIRRWKHSPWRHQRLSLEIQRIRRNRREGHPDKGNRVNISWMLDRRINWKTGCSGSMLTLSLLRVINVKFPCSLTGNTVLQCRLKVSSPLRARIESAIVEGRTRNMRTSSIGHRVSSIEYRASCIKRFCYTGFVFRTQPQTKNQIAV